MFLRLEPPLHNTSMLPAVTGFGPPVHSEAVNYCTPRMSNICPIA